MYYDESGVIKKGTVTLEEYLTYEADVFALTTVFTQIHADST